MNKIKLAALAAFAFTIFCATLPAQAGEASRPPRKANPELQHDRAAVKADQASIKGDREKMRADKAQFGKTSAQAEADNAQLKSDQTKLKSDQAKVRKESIKKTAHHPRRPHPVKRTARRSRSSLPRA